jgi:hypothetical protein
VTSAASAATAPVARLQAQQAPPLWRLGAEREPRVARRGRAAKLAKPEVPALIAAGRPF